MAVASSPFIGLFVRNNNHFANALIFSKIEKLFQIVKNFFKK
jgi:hypothetical protein